MVKEIERYGIPIVHMATITTISESVGANRICSNYCNSSSSWKSRSSKGRRIKIKKEMVERALNALGTEVEEPTQFE